MATTQNNFLAGLQTGYNIVRDFRETRRRRAREDIENQRGDEAYDELREQYGPAAAQRTNDYISLTNARRQEQDAARERQKAVGVTLVNTLRGFNSQIPEGTPPEQAAQMRRQAFGQFATVLPNLGLDNSQIEELGELYATNPQAMDALAQGLRDPDSLANQSRLFREDFIEIAPGQYAARQVDAAGNVRTVPVEGTPRSFATVDVQRGNLSVRQAESDPAYVAESSRARAFGSEQGNILAGLSRLDEVTDTAMQRIDELAQHPGLPGIYGLPDLTRLDDGGFGSSVPPVPGSQSANALALLNQTIGDIQTAAYESLRGGGQITEAEREAVAQGIANLERAQSIQAALSAMRSLRGVLDRRRNAAHRAANQQYRQANPDVGVQRERAPAREAPSQSSGRFTSFDDLRNSLRDR